MTYSDLCNSFFYCIIIILYHLYHHNHFPCICFLLLSNLLQTDIYYYFIVLYVRRSGGFSWLLSLGSYKVEIKILVGLCVPFWRLKERIHFLAHSLCWPNSVPCDYRTEVPVTLLTVIQGPLSASTSCLHSLAHGPTPS